MKNKTSKAIIILFLLILAVPVSANSLTFNYFLQKFESVAQRYDRGGISVPQMVVLLEYYKKENDEYLKENNIPGWQDVSSLDKHKHKYGYSIQTHDIDIYLGTYEVREGYYNFGYSIGGRLFTESYLENEWPEEIEDFQKDLKKELKKENPNFSKLAEQLFEIRKPMDRYNRCIDQSRSMEEIKKEELPDYLKGGYYLIQPRPEERRFKNTILEESYDDCLDRCWYEEDCEEVCSSYKSEIVFTLTCSKEKGANYFSVDHQGQNGEFSDFVNKLSSQLNSEFQNERCLGYDTALNFRKKLQNSINKEFFDWYVAFLKNNEEQDTAIGFERLMDFLIRNEKRVSELLKCKEYSSWPEEFQKIEIDYKNGNKEFHVWEEKVSTGDNLKAWSTLYKYKVMPSKEEMKRDIQEKLSQKSTFGPSEVEKEEIKQKKEPMEIIDKLVSGFGNSLDFAVVLDDNGGQFLKRYIKVNKDSILKISDSTEDNLDFTVTLNFDDLYDFANQMASIDSQKVRGPSWVDTESRTPMMIRERIGLVFNLWNNISFDSWLTKVRLVLKAGRIINYFKEIKNPSGQEEAVIQQIEEQLKTSL